MSDFSFCNETLEFLGGWLSGGKTICSKVIPNHVSDDLQVFSHKFSTEKEEEYLYRGLLESESPFVQDDKQYIKFDTLSSWTYSKLIASYFSDGIIIRTLVNKQQVFLDTTILDSKFIIGQLGGFPDEKEIILLPGMFVIDVMD